MQDGERLYPKNWSGSTPLGRFAREVAAWLVYVDPKHGPEKLIQQITKGTLKSTEAWTDGRHAIDDKYLDLSLSWLFFFSKLLDLFSHLISISEVREKVKK